MLIVTKQQQFTHAAPCWSSAAVSGVPDVSCQHSNKAHTSVRQHRQLAPQAAFSPAGHLSVGKLS